MERRDERLREHEVVPAGHGLEALCEVVEARPGLHAQGVPERRARPVAGRELGGGRLETLAQRLEVRATWEDLRLSEAQMRQLAEVELHVRRRLLVHETWGFSPGGWRGTGTTALFSGPSGTGKTLAAEVLAHQLGLDLYRIDLSGVVSKYIGETEKNLR